MGGDFRYDGGPQKAEPQYTGAGNGYLNASTFNRDYQPYQQPPYGHSAQAGTISNTMPLPMPQSRVTHNIDAPSTQTGPQSGGQSARTAAQAMRARRDEEDQSSGCVVA